MMRGCKFEDLRLLGREEEGGEGGVRGGVLRERWLKVGLRHGGRGCGGRGSCFSLFYCERSC